MARTTTRAQTSSTPSFGFSCAAPPSIADAALTEPPSCINLNGFDNGSDDSDGDDTPIPEDVWEGGLPYHGLDAHPYLFPHGPDEQIRQKKKHEMTVLLSNDRLHFAPIEEAMANGGKVLDIGTGTGLWAIELGDLYPKAQVLGIDISEIQPNFVPLNVKFEVDDMEKEWQDHPLYDYIHIRDFICTVRDQKKLMKNIFRHLKPGGYVEFQEARYFVQNYKADGGPTPNMDMYLEFMRSGCQKIGGNYYAIDRLRDDMLEVGFEDIRHVDFPAPLGTWPRDERERMAGQLSREAVLVGKGLWGLSNRMLCNGLQMERIEVEVLLAGVRREVRNTDPGGEHLGYPFHIYWARKPLDMPMGGCAAGGSGSRAGA